MTEYLTSFSPLALRFDAYILDLWGVIHDGQNPYPGAKDCLQRLRAVGKKIVLLSNAPRRAEAAAAGLQRMGVGPEAYDRLITSGETAYHCLAGGGSDYFHPAGKNYIYIGLEKDRRVLDGAGYEEVNDPHAANFLLLSHSYYDNQPESELMPLLARCLEAGLTALCINPDTEVVRLTGEPIYCAGVLAARYAAGGGSVVYFGKPHRIIYEKAFEALGGIDSSRILAVGDNLATDIAGAMKSGIKSTLVTGGVLKETLGGPDSEGFRTRYDALLAKTGAMPDYVIPAFNW